MSSREPLSGLFALKFREKAPPGPVSNVDPQHPHGRLAKARAQAHQWMRELAKSCSCTVYEISFSNRSNSRGFHSHYMARDYKWPERFDVPNGSDMMVMVDVDFYADMDYWMSFGRPIVMYTIVPELLHVEDKEHCMTFDGDDLTMTVDGGSTYVHRLWDYSSDETGGGGYQ